MSLLDFYFINPDTFESNDVARSGPVFTVVSTAWLQNNMAVQIKKSDLPVFLCVQPLLWHIASKNKKTSRCSTRIQSLQTRRQRCGKSATAHALLNNREESWKLEWIRIRVDSLIRFVYGYVWTRKLFNPERKVCGFKSIRIRVDGALFYSSPSLAERQSSRPYTIF